MSSRPYIVNRTASTEPVGQQLGDEWFNTTTNSLLKQVAVNGSAVTSAQVLLNIDNRVVTTGNITGGNIISLGMLSTVGSPTFGAFTLPNIDGTAGQTLTTYGNGVVRWNTSSSGSGSFQVITRTSGSRTVTISAGSFGVGTRNSGTRQVAVT
jgi:hypothetical protein